MDTRGAMTKKLDGTLSICFLILLLIVPVAGCGGSKPPLTMTVSQPTDGATVTQSSVRVLGTVSDPKATVTINGVTAAMTPKGTFGIDVALTQGENTINIIATRGGERVTKTLKVTFTSTRR